MNYEVYLINLLPIGSVNTQRPEFMVINHIFVQPSYCFTIIGQFLNLDTDNNGLLSRKELEQYNKKSIPGVLLDRVFQECQTYGGEMDYRGFLDFVLANENIDSSESIMYFFKLLDLKGDGYLDEFCIRYFMNVHYTF